MTDTETTQDQYDQEVISNFTEASVEQLNLYKQQYAALQQAYNQTLESDSSRRTQLRIQMNTVANNINQLQNTQVATYNAAVQNEMQARTTMGQQLGTLGVLNQELQTSQYNIQHGRYLATFYLAGSQDLATSNADTSLSVYYK